MPPSRIRTPAQLAWGVAASLFAVLSIIGPAAGVADGRGAAAQEAAAPVVEHLVISELATGGASASDEFIELYNPTEEALSLVGLEVIYVSASGATLSRRAGWQTGSVLPRSHLLIANESGIYAGIADVRYSVGLSATGGSVALRREDADVPIDALGWGTASSAWLEGGPAQAPAAGETLERLPGGDAGSGFDTDDNRVDFVVRPDPEPQNSGSDPTPAAGPPPTGTPPPSPAPSVFVSASPAPSPTAASPSGTATPTSASTPTAAATRTPAPSPSATGSPAPTAVPIAVARGLPDGSRATISGVALTPSAFNDGGGYLVDDTAGIAVLVSDGSFERGERLQVTGLVSDRYHQRTIRADVGGVSRLGRATDPAAARRGTGAVGEDDEGELVHLVGELVGTPVDLSSGRAYAVDDGSGAARVLVLTGTDVDTSDWRPGSVLELRGVVGQRDSTGTGASGYRVQPRDEGDVLRVLPATAPTASAPSAGPSRTPAATPQQRPVTTIAAARAAPAGTEVRVRGVVTAPAGQLVDDSSAFVQDATGGLLVRLTDGQQLAPRGALVELAGERGTKGGMATLRLETSIPLGQQPEPEAVRVASGSLSDELEARLIVIRGLVTSAVRQTSTGSVSFEIDDGSGAARVFIFPAAGIGADRILRGSWVEIRGVLGQETSSDRPDEGYRVWPRDSADVRTIAPPVAGSEASDGSSDGGARSGAAAGRGTGETAESSVSGPLDLGPLLAAADGTPATGRGTLVVGAWPEFGLTGVLWDGRHVLGVRGSSDAHGGGADGLPRVVEVSGAVTEAMLGELPARIVILEDGSSLHPARGAVASASVSLPADGASAAWVRLSGTVRLAGDGAVLVTPEEEVRLEYACDLGPTDAFASAISDGNSVIAEGIAGRVAGVALLLSPCAAVRHAPLLGGTTSETHEPAPEPDVAHAPGSPRQALLLAALVTALAAGGLLASVGALAWRMGTFGRLIAAYRPASSHPNPVEERRYG